MSNSGRATWVGALVVGGLLIFAAFLLKVGSSSGWLRDHVEYRARFSTIQGLDEGAIVRFRGVTVGSVRRVDFAPDPGANDIVVEISLRKSVAARIDEHVIAELRSNGPLGDKMLELRRLDVPPGQPIPPGGFIVSKPPLEIGDYLDPANDVYEDIQSISDSLRVITDRLVAGEGVVGRLLEDKEYGEKTLTDLQAAVAEIRRIAEATAGGKNLAGMLVGDARLAERISRDLQESLRSLSAVTARLERGEGVLGQLSREDTELSRAVSDLAVAAGNFRKFSEKMDAAEGSLLHRVALDPEFGRAVTDDVRATAAHLRSVAAKVDRGEGSVGRLLNDDGVYEGVHDIVRGVERSWFVNWMLKRQQKKGFKERVEKILRENPNPDAELLNLMREVLQEEEAARTGPLAAAPASASGPAGTP